MVRSVGISSLLASAPESVVVVFALLTQLGDAWFIFVAFSLLYWFGPEWMTSDRRRDGALLVALALCALAVTVGLKSIFALPRPPGAAEAVPPAWLPNAFVVVYADLATGDGFGFPSGHALGTTVAYGGAAVLLDAFDRRRRFLVAGGVVAVVALSRVVLGVHYLADVVAGVAVGAVLVVGVLRAANDPEGAFVVAIALGILAALAAAVNGSPGATGEAAAAVGGGLGGRVAWRYARSEAAVPTLVGVGTLVICGGLWAAAYALEPPLVAVVVIDAVAVGGILGLPWLVSRR